MIDPGHIVAHRPLPNLSAPVSQTTDEAYSSSCLNTERANDTASHRYFHSFYESFSTGGDLHLKALIHELSVGEARCRSKTIQIEERERVHFSQCFADVLGIYHPSLLYVNNLQPVEGEMVQRRRITFEYYQMYLEATEIHESMTRRCIAFVEEPELRASIEAIEIPAWIESRRLQVAREQQKQRHEESTDRWHRVAYFQWKQQQAYQVFLFQQSETQERMDIERQQRLNVGVIADLFTSEFRDARYHQLKYVMMKRTLSGEASHNLLAEEAACRSDILFRQRDVFRNIQGIEVRCFLGTRRNVLINEKIELL